MAGEVSIRERLRDPDARERLAALQALTGAPDPVYRGELVRLCMDDRTGPVRLQAARALKAFWPDPQVVRAYSMRVTDELPIAAEIIAILGTIGDTRAVDILEKAFHSAKDVLVKLKVLGQIHCASEGRIREFLMKTRVLEDEDERIRAAAVALLARVDNPTAMRAVVLKLKDPCPRVRANALEAVGARYAGVDVARVMVASLKDPHHRVRSIAIKFLLLYGVKPAEEHLQAMVESSEVLCRAAAAWVMREVRPTKRMAVWIARLANDSFEQVAAMAQAATERLGRAQAIPS
jgi:HEAT repeat protein